MTCGQRAKSNRSSWAGTRRYGSSQLVSRKLHIWDPNSRFGHLILEGHSAGVRALAVAPSGRWLASASADTTVRIWDPAAGTALRTLSGHENDVRAVGVGPDGRWLASASDDHSVRVWDTTTWQSSTALRTGHELVGVSLPGTPRRRENGGGLPADAGVSLGL